MPPSPTDPVALADMPLHPVALADMLVGTVFRHALDEIAENDPDKGKWFMDVLRKKLSRPEVRLIRKSWELPPRWPTVRRSEGHE